MLVLVLDITKNKKTMLKFIKPVPIILTVITMFGVLMHDMHIDKATTVAIALPAMLATTGALDKAINPSYHTHVERAELPRYTTFRSTLPNIQPPRDDDRRYIQNKKLLFVGGGDSIGLWPSV